MCKTKTEGKIEQLTDVPGPVCLLVGNEKKSKGSC